MEWPNQRIIVLPHSQFSRPQGTKESCNNGAIIARSLKGGNGTYTSQLSVTVTSELIGDAIECVHDNGTDTIKVVGMAIINETGMNLVLISTVAEKDTAAAAQAALGPMVAERYFGKLCSPPNRFRVLCSCFCVLRSRLDPLLRSAFAVRHASTFSVRG